MLPEPIPIKPVAPSNQGADGITRPRHAGGPARFLTDVIVDLGLVARERVGAAIDEARRTGRTPEDVLLEQGGLTADGLARAVAERHGLD
ncbi:MAG: type pilus assembly protein PilB, partial [Solirubrobacteraceae bacterium]|nr:type pilus assembly protein PilB [Solirubrobacteraceae bacterium]